jgi:hypothetical protein
MQLLQMFGHPRYRRRADRPSRRKDFVRRAWAARTPARRCGTAAQTARAAPLLRHIRSEPVPPNAGPPTTDALASAINVCSTSCQASWPKRPPHRPPYLKRTRASDRLLVMFDATSSAPSSNTVAPVRVGIDQHSGVSEFMLEVPRPCQHQRPQARGSRGQARRAKSRILPARRMNNRVTRRVRTRATNPKAHPLRQRRRRPFREALPAHTSCRADCDLRS